MESEMCEARRDVVHASNTRQLVSSCFRSHGFSRAYRLFSIEFDGHQ